MLQQLSISSSAAALPCLFSKAKSLLHAVANQALRGPQKKHQSPRVAAAVAAAALLLLLQQQRQQQHPKTEHKAQALQWRPQRAYSGPFVEK